MRRLSDEELNALYVTDMTAYLEYMEQLKEEEEGGKKRKKEEYRNERYPQYFNEDSYDYEQNSDIPSAYMKTTKKKKKKHKREDGYGYGYPVGYGTRPYSDYPDYDSYGYDPYRPEPPKINRLGDDIVRILVNIRDRINALEHGVLPDREYENLLMLCKAAGTNIADEEELTEIKNTPTPFSSILDPFGGYSAEEENETDSSDVEEEEEAEKNESMLSTFYVRYDSGKERIAINNRMTSLNIQWDMMAVGDRFELRNNIFSSSDEILGFIRKRLVTYMISHMYPNAVMPKDQFLNKTKEIRAYDKTKYQFVEHATKESGNHVFMYYIDPLQVDVLIEAIFAFTDMYECTKEEELDSIVWITILMMYDCSRDAMTLQDTEINELIVDPNFTGDTADNFIIGMKSDNSTVWQHGVRYDIMSIDEYKEIQLGIMIILNELSARDDATPYSNLDRDLNSMKPSELIAKYGDREKVEEKINSYDEAEDLSMIPIIDTPNEPEYCAPGESEPDMIPVHM